MKSGRLNYIGAASHTSVFASEARQSSAMVGQSGLPRRFDEGGVGAGLLRCARNDGQGVTA